MNIKLMLLPFAAILLVGMTTPSLVDAKDRIYTDWLGIAIKGYDPVAFHTEGQPVKGSDQYDLIWQDAAWRFSSAENRNLFEANPEKYAPQYGGYCAWAVAQGTTASVDPKNSWSIINGKLYLNYSKKIKEKWEMDAPGNIQKADANWPGVLK